MLKYPASKQIPKAMNRQCVFDFRALKTLPFLILTACYLGANAQVADFQKGRIVDSISVDTNTGESYALYVPNTVRTADPVPLVFIFHPAAQGKQGLQPFLKASETYGYVLVCSNDSKNGPYDTNLQIANRLFNKVLKDYSVDPRKMYTAGFSGGARLASTIAVVTKKIQGVIACGAGFSSDSPYLPFNEDFSYAAITGYEDMNFSELIKTKGWLNKLNISNELFIFDIGHQWPDQEQILEAFDWLQLEAFKKGISVTDMPLVQSLYNKFYGKAHQFEEDDKLLRASYEYERIIRNFSRYFQLDSIQTRLNAILSNKSYGKEKDMLAGSLEDEVALWLKYQKRFTKDLEKGNTKLAWWTAEMHKLTGALATDDFQKNAMIKRLLYKISAAAFETATISDQRLTLDQIIFCFDIAILGTPTEPYLYLKQIENYLLKNNQEMAFDYLERLLNSGFKNFEYLKRSRILEPLKQNPRFSELMQ
jgi:predicted esterase